MNFKKRITLTLIFLLVFNFLDSITIFAENLSINLMTNLKVNAIEVATDSLVNLKEKDIVELEVKCINNDNLIKPGDEIKVILPAILENVTIDYPIEYFVEKATSNENTYLLNFSDTIVKKSEVSFYIKGSVSEAEEDLEDSILINMNNNEEKIDVNVTKEKLVQDIKVNVLNESNDLEEGHEVNSNSEIAMLSETGFKAIGVKDNTKTITNKYLAKNGFQHVKDEVNYTTSAFDFHIFSKEANLNAHTNGNIATKDLFANNGAGFGTNQSTELKINEENYFLNSAQGINNIASDGNIIVGYNVPTNREDNNNKVNIGIDGSGLDSSKSSRVYKETSERINYIDIENEFENLKIISSLFSNHKTSLGVTLSELNGENQTIKVNEKIENTNNYYLNINASEISNESNKRVLNIEIPEGKTLIINVDMADVSINHLQKLVTKINDHNNSEEVVRHENNILWNLYDSSVADKVFTTGEEYALVGTSDYFMGTILAPNANIQYGAVNGSIIANKTKQNFQESHKWSFTGHINENTTTSATIEATKNLVGKELVADMFSFELLDKDDKVLQTVSNSSDGKVQFEAINYDVVGSYEYKVREVQGSLDGITYDKSEFKITVNVIDDGNEKLIATVIYPNNKIEFNNKYETKTAIVTIESTKKLIGKALEDGMFSFELLDKDNKVLQTVKNDVDGKIRFEAITYDSSGGYEYKVRETKGNLGGITYDESIFKITVNVTEDGQGKLVAKVIYPEDKVEFTNKYEVKETSATIEAIKKLTGKDLASGMFSFELLDKEGKLLETVSNSVDGKIQFTDITYDAVGTYKYKVREVKGSLGGVTYDEGVFDVTVNVTDNGIGKLVATVDYPNNKIEFSNKYEAKATSVSIEATKTLVGKELVKDMFSFELLNNNGKAVEKVKNDVDGKIKFSTLNFDKVGTYTYKIVEVNEGLDGIIYDSKDIDVTITVTDNGKGQLESEVKYPIKKPEFNNSYKAGSTSATIIATKKLTGKDLTSGMFSFELLDKDGNALQTITNSSDGTVKFADITYDAVGTYKYKVREVKGSLGGVSYDERVFDVTVNVVDEGNGKLVATVIYPNNKIEFSNKYEAKATSAAIEVTKNLTGKDLTSGMFSFELIDDKENSIETVENDVDGKIKFTTLNFDKVGTYTYKIVEVNEGIDGITYDSQDIDVTITVTDNGKGELEAELKYPSKKPEFNNSYKAGSTSTAIVATKELIGKDLVSGMFSFELLDKDGNLLQTVKNNKDGTVQFADITYDSIGDYEYTVREVQGNLDGITYDKNTFKITVNVSDNGKGKLIAKVVYLESKVVFENKIIQGSIEITKTDIKNGKPLANAEFTIRDSEGEIVVSGKTDKNGKVVFEELKYGKYTYQETAAPKGYIIDNKEYQFEIKEDRVVIKATMTNERKTVVTDKTSTPNTGDTGIVTALVIGLLGVGGLFINNKKKKNIKSNNS